MSRSILGRLIKAVGMTDRQISRLNDKELLAFVQRFLDMKNIFLSAVKNEGSPLYIIDTADLIAKAAKFRRAFLNVLPDVKIYYALKSNNHPLIASTLVGKGIGLDVSSGVELKLAIDCGARDIVFSGPGKSPDELMIAVEYADRVTVLLDSLSELIKLDKIACEAGSKIRAGIRIATDQSGIWRKFGIQLASLPELLSKTPDYQNVNLTGLQFHISWNLNPGSQVKFIERLGSELGRINKEYLEQLIFIDIGGGFWPERGEWLQPAATPRGKISEADAVSDAGKGLHFRRTSEPISLFASEIAAALEKNLPANWHPTICMEPGRWLCDDAMHILLTVADRKAADLVITDGGINAVGWERYETDFYPVINLSQPAMEEHKCLVAGSLCTPHDIWGYSYFGEDIAEGDILLIPCQGAYTYSLKQEFIKPLPKCVEITEFIRMADNDRPDG